jgi:hypothetical protein
LAVAVLAVLACLGAAMESPVTRDRAAQAGEAKPFVVGEAPAWHAVSHPQAINVASRNLQLPRAPRHRSDKPSSGAADGEGITANSILASLGDDIPRPFVSAAVRCCPLAGHPLSLLRPPSLLAG